MCPKFRRTATRPEQHKRRAARRAVFFGAPNSGPAGYAIGAPNSDSAGFRNFVNGPGRCSALRSSVRQRGDGFCWSAELRFGEVSKFRQRAGAVPGAPAVSSTAGRRFLLERRTPIRRGFKNSVNGPGRCPALRSGVFFPDLVTRFSWPCLPVPGVSICTSS